MQEKSFLNNHSKLSDHLQQNSNISEGGLIIGGNSFMMNQSNLQDKSEIKGQSLIGLSKHNEDDNEFLVRRNDEEQDQNEFGQENHFMGAESKQPHNQGSFQNQFESKQQQSRQQSQHMLEMPQSQASKQNSIHDNSFPLINNQSSVKSSKKVQKISLNQHQEMNGLVSKNHDDSEPFGREERSFGREENSKISIDKQDEAIALKQSSQINHQYNKHNKSKVMDQQSSKIASQNSQVSYNNIEKVSVQNEMSKQASKINQSSKSIKQQSQKNYFKNHQNSVLNQSNKLLNPVNNSQHSSIEKSSSNIILPHQQQKSLINLSHLHDNSQLSDPISQVKSIQKHSHDQSQQAMGLILGSNDYEQSHERHFPSADSYVQNCNSRQEEEYLDMSIAQKSNIQVNHDNSKGVKQKCLEVQENISQVSIHQSQQSNQNSKISHPSYQISHHNQQPSNISSQKQHFETQLNESKSSHKQSIIQNHIPTITHHVRKQSNASISNHFKAEPDQKEPTNLNPVQILTPNRSNHPDSLKYSQNNTISRQQISLQQPYSTQKTLDQNLVSNLSQTQSKKNQQTRYQDQLESNYEQQVSANVIDSIEPVRIQSSRQNMRKPNRDQPYQVQPISMKIHAAKHAQFQATNSHNRFDLQTYQQNYQQDDLPHNDHQIQEQIHQRSRKQSTDHNDRILQSQDFGNRNQPITSRKRVETEFDIRQKQITPQKFTQISLPYQQDHPQSASVFQTEIYPNTLANSKLTKIREVKQLKKKKLQQQLAKLSVQIESLTKKQQQIKQWNSPAKKFNQRLKINNNIQARQKAISMVKNLQKQRKTRQMQKISSIDKIDVKINDYMSELTKIRIQNQQKLKERRKLQIIQRMKSKEMKRMNQIKKIEASSKFVSQFTKAQHKQSRGSLLSPRAGNRDVFSPESGARKSTRQQDYDDGLTPQLANKKAYLNRVRNLSQKRNRNHLHHQEKVDIYENKLY